MSERIGRSAKMRLPLFKESNMVLGKMSIGMYYCTYKNAKECSFCISQQVFATCMCTGHLMPHLYI